jgi:DNA repair protein RecN (Recombination protein N)
MLKELRIENFAIIDQLELLFGGGLTAFTGETGAGKSILLDAIEALMGGRAEVTMIRSNADRATLEAVFTIPEQNRKEIIALLTAEELLDDEQEIIFNREIRRNGRNAARINGHAVSVTLMREIGSYLVDIHGQSEHLSLLTVRQHLNLLDRYADNSHLLEQYQQVYEQMKKVRAELETLRKTEQDATRQTDLLTYQIQEIDAARLEPGEEDTLRGELTRLANAEKLASLAQAAFTLLEESTPDAQSISGMLGEVTQSIQRLAHIDDTLQDLADQSETAAAQLADVSLSLQEYMDQIEFNPRRLTEVENRLVLLTTLKKKYGADEQSILDFADDARLQLENISHAEERIQEMEQQESTLMQQLSETALALSAARQSAGKSLSQQVESELADLKMAGARFSVSLEHKPDQDGVPIADGTSVRFTRSGIDQAEFLIAPNPGEGLKPLVKIASGGETSRLMLALKNVLAKADTIPVLIFDEIDQGIGGRVGAIVGEKLWQLGRSHQVLCVTHLAQLAAYGNQHFHVYKRVDQGRTHTVVEELRAQQRLVELALMFGSDSEANRTAAREALEMANQFKISHAI